MFGPGYGFSTAGSMRRRRRAGGGTPTPTPSATGTLTLTAIPSYEEKRIYQRLTTSGGGQGKGVGNITLAISGALAGTINIRVLSDDLTTVLQTLPDATLTNGQTSLLVASVDARYGWFLIEVRDSSGTWQRTTYKCGMGALFGMAGQSLMVRMFGRQDGQTATYASLGITPDPCSAALISYDGNAYNPAVSTQPWITPGDLGNGNGPNSVGIGELLNRLIGLLGVNCGAVGAAVGGTGISDWTTGGLHSTRLTDRLARAGGAFEGFFWGQGHGNSVHGQPPKAYQGALTILFAMITAANRVPGYGKYLFDIPAIRSETWGTPYTYNRIRKGADDWCNANGGYHVHAHDIAQVDAIHESQAGAVTLARCMYRAAKARYAGDNSHLGPVPMSATRIGTMITLTLSDVGQSTINLVGTPGNRLFLFPRGRVDRATLSNNRFPVSSVAVVNKTTLTIVLANDPGDGHDLDLWVYWPNGPADATADNIYDDRTDADGIAVGRFVRSNFMPIQVSAPSPGGPVNAPPGGFVAATSPFSLTETGTVYGASAGGSSFGQEMTSGRALAGGLVTPCFLPVAIEGFFTCPPAFAATQVLFGGFGPVNSYWVGINTSGKMVCGNNSITGATTLVAGRRYHFCFQIGPSGWALYLTDLSAGTGGVKDATSATVSTMVPVAGSFGLRTIGGSFPLSGGAVDEIAVFNAERYADVTTYNANRPTAPLTGTEADIVALYRCDNDARDAVAA
ncbi:sialate O-acetylesterase [Sphingobium nicotianae]|uniref:Sialate O-acetylesterase domain-containing protein n=1 Tax=Sphingobium nicotianae TaxID=2782607 RepID=A0A9X1IPP0_9SPHN|nr:sialate O-acetylesterase [Sphingobium nicotianae]MBT2186179.1 hypothetical protein [Sphingobium nicotianae]